MEYKVVDYCGNSCVVRQSERKEYNYTQREKVNGEEVVKKVYMAAPYFMGIEGLALCGVLMKNETLEHWIEVETKKQLRNDRHTEI